jgi:hypothetical protein
MPPHETVLGEAPDIKNEQASTRWQGRWPLIAVILLGILAVVGGIVATRSAGEVEDQKDRAVDTAQNLGQQVVAACAQGLIVQDDQGRDLCQRAAQVQSTPVPGVPIQGDRGPGPTPEQIEAAVVAYCAARDQCAGSPPSTGEVAAAVAEYLIANPPDPGRPPTAAEIAEQVTIYFANNPPPQGPEGERGPRGEAGATGARGPGPTAEEIQAAVDAHLAANPPPRGEPGPSCPPGSTLQPVVFASGESGLGCVTGTAPTTEPPEPTTTPPPTTDMDDGELLGE